MTTPPSFDQVYAKTHALVDAVCRGITQNAALAEDAQQETFLLVHRALPAFRAESSISTWVYRIALRAALRQRNQHRRQARLESVAPVPAPAPVIVGDTDRLQAALDSLPDEHRTILVLMAIRELPASIVADLLSIPVGTVYSRAHHARRELLRRLG